MLLARLLTNGWHQIANADSEMCLDSSAGPEEMKKPVNVWPCHGEYGNQVCLKAAKLFIFIAFAFSLVGVGSHHHCYLGKFGSL